MPSRNFHIIMLHVRIGDYIHMYAIYFTVINIARTFYTIFIERLSVFRGSLWLYYAVCIHVRM